MKYYIMEGYDTEYDLLLHVCAEGDMLAEEGDPFIILDSKEYASFKRAQTAWANWQERICEAREKCLPEPTPIPAPLQTMEDYKKEVEEFLK